MNPKNFLFAAFLLTLAANVNAQTQRSIEAQEFARIGEAVEFRLVGAAEADDIDWLILSPSIKFKTFENSTSLIIDPPVDFTGEVEVLCRVVNFETSEKFDARAKVLFVSSSFEIPEQKPAREASRISELESVVQKISFIAAPKYDGEVAEAYENAGLALRRGVDLETVNNGLAEALTGKGEAWAEHFDKVFSQLEGVSVSRADELYLAISRGIKDRKDE